MTKKEIDKLFDEGFNDKQISEIMIGYEDKLSEEQMSILKNVQFNSYQMSEIRLGFMNGLTMDQVKKYADSKNTRDEMFLIRRYHECANDVDNECENIVKNTFKEYTNVKYTWEQKHVISVAIAQGYIGEKLRLLANPIFNGSQMKQINLGFQYGLNIEEVNTYSKPEYDEDKMHEILEELRRQKYENDCQM